MNTKGEAGDSPYSSKLADTEKTEDSPRTGGQFSIAMTGA